MKQLIILFIIVVFATQCTSNSNKQVNTPKIVYRNDTLIVIKPEPKIELNYD